MSGATVPEKWPVVELGGYVAGTYRRAAETILQAAIEQVGGSERA